MRALCFERFGGPEVLRVAEVPDPVLRPGHALVRMHAIGLNFADIYRRRGSYHLQGNPPYIAGYEGAGVVEAVEGPAAIHVRPGDRVAFADCTFANAELVLLPLDRLIPLPADISFTTAAALLLQGLTAHYLCRDSHPLRAGEDVLVHAAAGGVGLLLTQIARKIVGARVLGLASTPAKQEAAIRAGADAVADSNEDWVQAAQRFSRVGTGVDVAYDSIGMTVLRSFAATRTGGRVVFYGMAGGDPPMIDPRMLMDTSKTLTGGDLWNVLTSYEERVRRATEIFSWVRSGQIEVRIAASFPLDQGAQAHTFLEGRTSIGKVLLIP